MYIAILGANAIGSYVASALAQNHHDVVLIDANAEALKAVSRESDLATLHAPGPLWKALQDNIQGKPDLFFAATDEDAVNLVASVVVKELGFPKTAVRIQERELLTASEIAWRRLFHVDHFINAELLAAQDLFKLLIHSSDIAVEQFAQGTVQMRTLLVPKEWKHANLAIQDLALPDDLIVGLIRRKLASGEEAIVVPCGRDSILEGDEVTVVGKTKAMQHLHALFQLPEQKAKSVVLAGGSSIAIQLTYFLLHQKISVRIIDPHLQRCEELARRFPNATIIHRDPKESSLLLSERIQEADALVACTQDDAINFQIAALAKQLGCPKALASLTDPALSPLLEKLGVTPALSAKANLTHQLLSILHGETILAVSPLSADQAKIVEMKVSPSSPLIGIPLSQLSLPQNVLIAVIETQGHISIGRGHHTLNAHDTAIAICQADQLTQLHTLFR